MLFHQRDSDYHDAGRFGSLTLPNATGKGLILLGTAGQLAFAMYRAGGLARRPYP